MINSFATEDAYVAFVENVFRGFQDQKLKDAKRELEDFLPELSKKGSGDDLSIAVITEKQK